ncbi:regulatory protein FlaEY [hydrothermal vent metagenome]|uniref:Regulatory protein FlaEY n=1 Tax=hydrothermal vent metagenome TaxID=652676 RepID=A0A3B0R917_9ZZZZ
MADFGSFRPLTIGADLLLGSFQAGAALRQARAFAAAGNPQTLANIAKPDTSVPPPWDVAAKPLGQQEILTKALATGNFFFEDLESFSDSAAPEDQKKLFALYQGLRRLSALGIEAADKTVVDSRRRFLDRRLGEGIAQLESFLAKTDFEELSFLKGAKASKADSTLAIERNRADYVTGVVYDGTFDDVVPSLAGNVQFTITAKRVTGDVVVNVDLAGMGATPRTLDNVADFINTQLSSAGLFSTFKREKIGEPDENGIIAGNQFGFKILGSSVEPLEFSTSSSSAAIYVAGISGIDDTQTARFSKYDGEAAGAPAIDFSTRLEAAADANTEFLATKIGANGEIYAIVRSDGAVAGLTPQGEDDIYLVRYDSAGKTVFTRGLGAVGDVDVNALAIGADGSINIAGKVSGVLGNTTQLGGTDSFVAKYDANGKEQFIKRFGVSTDDQANTITLAADGTIFVAGSTTGALTGTANGATDAYIRALDSSGNTLFTRQFGTAADESVKAIALDANGDLLVASEENGVGKLARFGVVNGTDPAIWQTDLGALDAGSISSINVNGTAILVGGSAGAANGLGAGILSPSGDRDGFLIRVDEDAGGVPQRQWTTFLGTASTDAISGIDTANGKLYATGTTTGNLPGGGILNGTSNAFVSRFDLATGALEGTSQLGGAGGVATAAAIAIDPAGTSVLDVLGLPRGLAATFDSRVVAERSIARDGDSFQISVDGGPKRTVKLDDDDTYRALTFKINAVLILKGKSETVRGSVADTLRIEAAEGSTIELFAGPEGQDLLAALGIPEGVVQKEAKQQAGETSSAAPPVYGLGLKSGLDLSTLTAATNTNTILDDALTKVRDAYRQLTLDPALKNLLNGGGNNSANGPVPAYLTAQIANYSAGLARLGGG